MARIQEIEEQIVENVLKPERARSASPVRPRSECDNSMTPIPVVGEDANPDHVQALLNLRRHAHKIEPVRSMPFDAIVDVGPFAGPADYMSPRSYTPSMYMTQESVATIPDPAGREPEREAPETSPASSSLGTTVPYSPKHFTRDPDSQAGAAQQQPGDEERVEPVVQKVGTLADAKAAGRLLDYENLDREELNDAM